MEGAKLDILNIIWHSGFVVKVVLGLLIAASVYSWAIILKKKKLFALAPLWHNNIKTNTYTNEKTINRNPLNHIYFRVCTKSKPHLQRPKPKYNFFKRCMELHC